LERAQRPIGLNPNLVLFLFQIRKIRDESRKRSKDRSKIPKVSAYGRKPGPIGPVQEAEMLSDGDIPSALRL
jgi:hypothetical protein